MTVDLFSVEIGIIFWIRFFSSTDKLNPEELSINRDFE